VNGLATTSASNADQQQADRRCEDPLVDRSGYLHWLPFEPLSSASFAGSPLMHCREKSHLRKEREGAITLIQEATVKVRRSTVAAGLDLHGLQTSRVTKCELGGSSGRPEATDATPTTKGRDGRAASPVRSRRTMAMSHPFVTDAVRPCGALVVD
jgi:hypothetical protein